MISEVLKESPKLTPNTTGMDRAVLNNALLDGICSKFFTANLVGKAVSAGRIPLGELSGSLNLSGIQELSPLQRMVYNAITDPDRYVQTMPEIAWDLNIRIANFQRLCGRVYSHLGIQGRGQAVVFRLANEINNA